jgi:hypothetical protein
MRIRAKYVTPLLVAGAATIAIAGAPTALAGSDQVSGQGGPYCGQYCGNYTAYSAGYGATHGAGETGGGQ